MSMMRAPCRMPHHPRRGMSSDILREYPMRMRFDPILSRALSCFVEVAIEVAAGQPDWRSLMDASRADPVRGSVGRT